MVRWSTFLSNFWGSFLAGKGICFLAMVFLAGPFSVDVLAQGNKAPEELIGLLERAERSSKPEARRLLHQVIQLLEKEASLADRETVARRFALALEKAAVLPQEVEAVLGSRTPRTLARQIFYGRYREQWIIDQPLALCIVFDCIQGNDRQVQTVLALDLENP